MPLSWNIPKLLSYFDFGCDKSGKAVYSAYAPWSNSSDYDKCINAYRSWLTIDEFSASELFVNFINVFMMVCYEKYFTGYKTAESEAAILKSGDKNDFMESRHKDFLSSIRYLYYAYFWIIPLIIMILGGIGSNVIG